MSILIQNGQLLINGERTKKDIYIEDGIIKEISEDLSHVEADKIINAEEFSGRSWIY